MGGVEFIGKVVSNRMQKTVVVAVNYVVWIPKYKVYEKRVSRHKAHDGAQACNIGDVVRIRKCRKLSKEKSYAVVDTLRRANVFTRERAQGVVSSRMAAAPLSMAEAAMQRVQGAEQRLAKLREMYVAELGPGARLTPDGLFTAATSS